MLKLVDHCHVSALLCTHCLPLWMHTMGECVTALHATVYVQTVQAYYAVLY